MRRDSTSAAHPGYSEAVENMATRTLALFDLDETLIAGDSDYEWGLHLVSLGVVDRETYQAKNQEFYDRYRAGTLVLQDFLDFQLSPLSQFPRAQLDAWHAEFLATRILPMIRPAPARCSTSSEGRCA